MIKETQLIIHHDSRFGTAAVGARDKVSILMSMLYLMDGLVGKTRSSVLAGLGWGWWSCIYADMSQRQFESLSKAQDSSGGNDRYSWCHEHSSGPNEVVYMANSSDPSTDPWGTTVER